MAKLTFLGTGTSQGVPVISCHCRVCLSPDEREIDKIRGVDTLVINALRKEPHLSHFTLDDALRISRAVSSNVTYLTHVSHQMGRHAEEQAALPEGVYFAYDGLTVEIPE